MLLLASLMTSDLLVVNKRQVVSLYRLETKYKTWRINHQGELVISERAGSVITRARRGGITFSLFHLLTKERNYCHCELL